MESNDPTALCRAWSSQDPLLLDYHDFEWCHENHDDRYQFEMLCLEGASVGLSWRTIMHKRMSYKEAFFDFDIEACARMTDAHIETCLGNPSLVRNRGKIQSVRTNAQAVLTIQAEFGTFDRYLWGFAPNGPIVGGWRDPCDIPTQSVESIALSNDMRKRGIRFVGAVITYSFMQAIGIVNDHLAHCTYSPCKAGSVEQLKEVTKSSM